MRVTAGKNVSVLLLWVGTAVSMFLLMLGWIPFRADGLDATFVMLAAFIDPGRWFFLGMRENIYLVTFLVFLLVVLGPLFWRVVGVVGQVRLMAASIGVWVASTIALAAVLIYLRPLEQFIYFQF